MPNVIVSARTENNNLIVVCFYVKSSVSHSNRLLDYINNVSSLPNISILVSKTVEKH